MQHKGGQLFGALMLAGISSTAMAGPPFETDDAEVLDYRHTEMLLIAHGTRSSTGLTHNHLPHFEVNYGFAPNMHLHALITHTYNRPTDGAAQHGIGDSELGIKYRLMEETDSLPQLAIHPLVVIPTGDADRGLGGGHTQTYLPLWLQKSWGDWTSYGGGGYWRNPGVDNKDWWFTGWELQRQITDNLWLGGEIFHRSADKVDGTDTTSFNLGGGLSLGKQDQLFFSAGRGIKNRDNNQSSYYLSYSRSF